MKKLILASIASLLLGTTYSSAGWVTPKGVGEKRLEDTKAVCEKIGAKVPTVNELKKVITSCGGVVDDWEKNENNSAYKSCVKKKGFSSEKWYWSSTLVSGKTYNAKVVDFRHGTLNDSGMDSIYYLRCVK